MQNIRKEIARRLKYEFDRRNLTSKSAERLSGVSESIISNYLTARREIKFSEVGEVCNSIGVNPIRLLYNEKYPHSKLAFRNIQPEMQLLAAQVEDAFLLIKEFLPRVDIPRYSHSDKEKRGYEIKDIVAEAAGAAEKITKQYKTPEEFIAAFSIPVFPISSSKIDFDAFAIFDDANAAICINTKKSPQRIRFSLAHEIAHLLYDRDSDLPVDVFIPDLYWKTKVNNIDVPEFFAYKFAEFYLIPFNKLVPVIQKWPIDKQKCQRIIDEWGASKEVLANALYDALEATSVLFSKQSSFDDTDYDNRVSGDQFRRMDWEAQPENAPQNLPNQVRFNHIKILLNDLKASDDARMVYSFLEGCKQNIKSVLNENKDSFSDIILEDIVRVLQIELR